MAIIKGEVTYREFGQLVLRHFNIIDLTDEELKNHIDKLMPLAALKTNEMSRYSGLTYDICRSFKDIAKYYEPYDPKAGKWSFKIIFKWYDFWVGLYWDKANRRLYVMPVPMLGFYIGKARND